ncbi:unnamed protein product, partial [Symbiodinium necroappetens]
MKGLQGKCPTPGPSPFPYISFQYWKHVFLNGTAPESLIPCSSDLMLVQEQRLEENAPIAVGERRSSSSSALEEHQSVPMAPRGSVLLFEQDPAPAREAALPAASAHREIHISEGETQAASHSAMPVEKGSALVG